MTSPATPRRHALGLPAGSVRAMLALTVLALLWIIALTAPVDRDTKREELPQVFVYLLILMAIILVHYFSAHGKSMGSSVSKKHALGLPRGSIRFLLMGGFIGLVVMLWQKSPLLKIPEGDKLFQLFGLLLLGFFAGYLLSAVFRGQDGQLPFWFQDVQAWLALVGAVGLSAVVIIYGVVNPSVETPLQINTDTLETGLAALVGFYFGARS